MKINLLLGVIILVVLVISITIIIVRGVTRTTKFLTGWLDKPIVCSSVVFQPQCGMPGTNVTVIFFLLRIRAHLKITCQTIWSRSIWYGGYSGMLF